MPKFHNPTDAKSCKQVCLQTHSQTLYSLSCSIGLVMRLVFFEDSKYYKNSNKYFSFVVLGLIWAVRQGRRNQGCKDFARSRNKILLSKDFVLKFAPPDFQTFSRLQVGSVLKISAIFLKYHTFEVGFIIRIVTGKTSTK